MKKRKALRKGSRAAKFKTLDPVELTLARIILELHAFQPARGRVPKGKRGAQWENLKVIKITSTLPGADPLRLDDPRVKHLLNAALKANDWECLHALCYWQKHHKPASVDSLAQFIVENWDKLRYLSDKEIAAEAKAKGIGGVSIFAVRDRRLWFPLKRFR